MDNIFEMIYESNNIAVVLAKYDFSDIPVHVEVYEKQHGYWLQVLDKPIMETVIDKTKEV